MQKSSHIKWIALIFLAIFVNFVNAQTFQDNSMQDQNNNGVIVELKTTMGDITVLLYNDTPLHRDNFVKLVKEGYYDGLLFHRVINEFMIQTGDPESRDAQPGKMLGSGSPDYTIEAEIDYPKHYNKYGALAAARTGDQFNPERRSSGSQFYIVTGRKMSEQQFEAMQMRKHQEELQNTFQALAAQHMDTIRAWQKEGKEAELEELRQQLIKQTEEKVGDNIIPENIKKDYIEKGGAPHLDGAYTVFGEVLSGMDVVEKIQKVETDSHDRPLEDVKIISAKVIKNN
ncbi:MAG: peptidylprolyl isomerase [Muribaculaceae bacterium]|nr:peptidylprolyl isomerase [Muribaculaceae bacterium]